MPVTVYTIDVHSIPSTSFGRETFSCREDAEWFIEEIRRQHPEHASALRIEEKELGTGRQTRSRVRSGAELARAT
jgi:hypothetical protein